MSEEKYDWTKPIRCPICDGIVAPNMPQTTMVDNVYHKWCREWFDEEVKKIQDNPRYANTGVLLATPRDWVRMQRKQRRIDKIFAGLNL